MPIPIEDHTRWLGIKNKTVDKLKAINIETLEDLAESSIETLRAKLSCTKERAKVLINKARRKLHPSGGTAWKEALSVAQQATEDRATTCGRMNKEDISSK